MNSMVHGTHCTFAHAAHLYSDSEELCTVVAAFARRALAESKGMMLIATPPHTEMMLEHLETLGVDVAAACASGRIQCHDALRMLEYLMDGRRPDRLIFEGLVCDAITQMNGRRCAGIAVFGEMVNILCERGRHDAAELLEQWWNELIERHQLELLCGYRADPLDVESREVLALACRTHSRLTVEDERGLHDSLDAALRELFPGGDGHSLRAVLAQHAGGPGLDSSAAAIIGLRQIMPQLADAVLASARRRT